MHAAGVLLLAVTILTCATREANSYAVPMASDLNIFDDYDYGSDSEYDDECGVPGVEPNIYMRIVGGVETEPHSWPWHTKIKLRRPSGRYSFFCGGSLIHPRYCITAAHCVYNMRANHLKLVLGDHDRTVYEDTQISVGVEKVIVHPGYVGLRNYWRHDLAVLKLDRDVKFTKYIRPICLPWHSCEADVANCYVTGWGKNATNGRPLKRLHQVSMKYYPNEQCNQHSWYDNLVQPTMLCAGHAKGGKGTCQGDSGGPLACLGRDALHWTLEGITSWARGSCASTKHPTVFTRMCYYVDWVHEVMMGNQDYYEYSYEYPYYDTYSY